MVLTSTSNKENIGANPSASCRPVRRHRSRPHTVNPSRTQQRVVQIGALDATTENTTSPTQRSIALPRRLQRPTFREITRAAITAVDPDLAAVSIEYIHQKIQAVGQQLHVAAAKLEARCPAGRLPRELEVLAHATADTPTHVLAVYSAHQKQRIALHPAHALVLAASCAHLPPLPRPEHVGSLPVIPLCIPSPATFPLLLEYLYTRRSDRLLAVLLPPIVSPPDGRNLADKCTIPASALLAHASRTYALWSNVSALGIFDTQLWLTIDTAWERLLGALVVTSGQVSL